MEVINTQFYFGLFACLIPIILYFLFKKKIQRIEFSSIRFLKEINSHSKIKTSLLELIILLLRVLSIVFFIFAFVEIVLSNNPWYASNIKTSHFLILDRSIELNITQNKLSLLEKRNNAVLQFLDQVEQNEKVYVIDPITYTIDVIHKENVQSVLETLFPVTMDSIPQKKILNEINKFLGQDKARSYSTYYIGIKDVNLENAHYLSSTRPVKNDKITKAEINSSILKSDRDLFLDMSFVLGTEKTTIKSLDIIIDNKTVYSDYLEKNSLEANIGKFSKGVHFGEVILTTDDDFKDDNYFYFNFKVDAFNKILVFTGADNSYLEAFFKNIPDSSMSVTFAKNSDFYKFDFTNYDKIFYEGENVSAGFFASISSYLNNPLNTFIYIPTNRFNGDIWNRSTFNKLFKLGALQRNKNELNINNVMIRKILNTNFNAHITIENFWNCENNFVNILGSSKTHLLSKQANLPFYFFNVPFNRAHTNFVSHTLFSPTLYMLINMSQPKVAYDGKILKAYSADVDKESIVVKSKTDSYLFNRIIKENFVSTYYSENFIPPGNYTVSSNADLFFSVNPKKFIPLKEKIREKNILSPNSESGSLWRLCVLLALLCYLTEFWLGRNFKK